MSRRWGLRALTFLLLYAVSYAALQLLEFEPEPLRLFLLMALGFAVVVLLLDALADEGPPWDDDPVRPMVVAGSDVRLAAYVRMLESHQTSAAPDTALRDRLRALCDERLARRHALTRDDPAAEDLLGGDLLRDLAGPVRRLSRADVGRYLERIEKL